MSESPNGSNLLIAELDRAVSALSALTVDTGWPLVETLQAIDAVDDMVNRLKTVATELRTTVVSDMPYKQVVGLGDGRSAYLRTHRNLKWKPGIDGEVVEAASRRAVNSNSIGDTDEARDAFAEGLRAALSCGKISWHVAPLKALDIDTDEWRDGEWVESIVITFDDKATEWLGYHGNGAA